MRTDVVLVGVVRMELRTPSDDGDGTCPGTVRIHGSSCTADTRW